MIDFSIALVSQGFNFCFCCLLLCIFSGACTLTMSAKPSIKFVQMFSRLISKLCFIECKSIANLSTKQQASSVKLSQLNLAVHLYICSLILSGFRNTEHVMGK